MLSMIFLSDAERAQLKTQHRRERDGEDTRPVRAVLLFDKGWSIASIAEALLLSEDAIREHINEYRESKKLKPENGGSVQKGVGRQRRIVEQDFFQLGCSFHEASFSRRTGG